MMVIITVIIRIAAVIIVIILDIVTVIVIVDVVRCWFLIELRKVAEFCTL